MSKGTVKWFNTKKGYGLFTLRVVILNHEINKHRREWLCIY